MSQNILEIKDLFVQYSAGRDTVRAVNGINLTLEEGESLGLVGETGAGKTTTALSIMRLIPNPPGKITGGEILYRGENLMEKSEAEMRKIRGHEISMIFQDPMTALNPMLSVGDQIAEVIRLHEKISRADAMRKACEMMEVVGIEGGRAGEYPHQFSGGMKQRIVIAIALACNPSLLIADEPTTALDVTIQAQVLELIEQLKRKFNTSLLLVITQTDSNAITRKNANEHAKKRLVKGISVQFKAIFKAEMQRAICKSFWAVFGLFEGSGAHSTILFKKSLKHL